MHLRSISYNKPDDISRYPFNINILKDLKELEFNKPVTIFVGENGTGKSTLLEGIAIEIDSISICGNPLKKVDHLENINKLANCLSLKWSKKTNKGFILRAEDFLSYIQKIHDMRKELRDEIEEVDKTYIDRSEKAKDLAKQPYLNSLYQIEARYGEGLDKKSHGESFLEFFTSRFVPDGVFLLDEPEAPLSPTKQLSLIAMINDMVGKNGQFIIATHSPMLMAIPGAEIVLFDDDGLKKVKYEDLDHVNITRDFLNNPESFLRHL